ncbi:hypothetical protein PS862_02643 [Pseudomonas fluorescens]|uniref:Uncharacterized protein n=1 Tax=Pseudomonas fluorescens TaxID=294 RepID=A0A5E6TGU8_PSEFL|nr:hypothetical protein PS639_02814 [Pseudomonas fluorescens]VVO97066.1 hypothetical protein PS862_02643 [Pseudomonas fluorescens]
MSGYSGVFAAPSSRSSNDNYIYSLLPVPCKCELLRDGVNPQKNIGCWIAWIAIIG